MANINSSIKLGSGFLLKGAPVDLKLTAATIEERNSYVTANALYKGAMVYVEETDLFYVYTGLPAASEDDFSPCWKELLGEVATDTNVVKVTGDQTVEGVKTFVSAPKIGTETVTTVEAVAAIKSELQGAIDSKKDNFEFGDSETIEFGADAEGKVIASVKAEKFDAFGAAAAAQSAAEATAAGALASAKTELEGKIAEKQNILSVESSETVTLDLTGDKLTASVKAEKFDAFGAAEAAASAAQAAAIADAEGKLAAAKAELQGAIDSKQDPVTFSSGTGAGAVAFTEDPAGTVTAKLAASGVTAGVKYNTVTLDASGVVVAAENVNYDVAGAADAVKKELTEGIIADNTAAAAAAQQAAKDAADVASAAQTQADKGVQDAAAAKTAADEAKSAADDAQDTADKGVADAAAAKSAADEAKAQADKGVAAAAAAQGKADTNAQAIEGLNGRIDALESKTEIDDTKASATTTYSSSKIEDVVATAKQAVKDDLLGGAGEAYDTLKELGAAIDENKDLLEAFEEVAAGHVAFDKDQTGLITSDQAGVARANIKAASQEAVEAAQKAADDAAAAAAKAGTDATGALASAKTELEGKIADAQAAAEEAAADALASAKTELEGKITAAETAASSALASAKTELEGKITAAEEAAAGALASAKTELEGKITAAEEAAKTAAAEDAATKVAALKKELLEGAIKDNADAAGAAQDKADANEQAIEGLDGRIEALEQANEQVLDVAHGGTGVATLAANEIVLGNGTGAVKSIANGEGVLVGSASGAPAFGKVALASAVDGVLPLANGGTGVANADSKDVKIGDFEFKTTAGSVVTVPASGVLATLEGEETFKNKTFVADDEGVALTAEGAIAVAGGVAVTGNIAGSGASVLSGFIIDGGEY